MNMRKILGGGYCKCSIHLQYKERGQALILVPLEEESPKGGSRWYKGVTPCG